jgi:hypothetical protein
MFGHIVVKIQNMKLHENSSGRSEQEASRRFWRASGSDCDGACTECSLHSTDNVKKVK